MPAKPPADAACALCERRVPLQFHHLIPRKVHRRVHFRKHYAREALNRGVYLCRLCHRGVHKLHDEMSLAKHYHSLEQLKGDPRVAHHVGWVKKQKTS